MTRLDEVFQRLLEVYGPQHWWPGESGFEIIAGAILTQNTSWKNVELALANLRSADALSVSAMRDLSPSDLEELIRPAGYFRLKARRLANLVSFVVERHEASVDRMFQCELHELRDQLLSINGIGPETADSILLYAGGLPSFVVDSYTARLVMRHGWLDVEADYHQVQAFFEESLPPDVALFNEFHALIVQVGKQHCGKIPDCEACPLKDCLPAGGPVVE